jgi:hypothetical protein
MFAGTLSSSLIADGTNVFHVGWREALGTAGGAALLSILASVAKHPIGPRGPGFTETTVRVDDNSGSE